MVALRARIAVKQRFSGVLLSSVSSNPAVALYNREVIALLGSEVAVQFLAQATDTWGVRKLKTPILSYGVPFWQTAV